MAEGIEDAVTAKIGPLPGYAWVLLIGGGAWAVYAWRKSHSSQAVAVTPVADASGVMPVAVGDAPGTNTGSGYTAAGPQGTSTPTNASWAAMVADALISGGSDPSATSNALSNYLNGNTLDSTQQSIVNTALRQYGSPPNGVLPVQSGPAFVGHVYTVGSGDTLDSINKTFYGRSSAIDQQLIADANPGLLKWNGTGWSALAPGTKLKLPQTGIAGVQKNALNTYDTPPKVGA